MRVRTRLVASFAYVLLVVIVALTVPLAIVLRDRARSELEAVALGSAQTIASVLNRDRLEDDATDRDASRPTRTAGPPRWVVGSSSWTPPAPSWPTPTTRTSARTSRRRDVRRSPTRSRRGRARRSVAATRRAATSPSRRRRSSTRGSSWARCGSHGAWAPSRRTWGAPPRRSSRWRWAGSSPGSSSRRARSLARAPALVARHDGSPARRGRAHRPGRRARGRRRDRRARGVVRRDGGARRAHGAVAAGVRRERVAPAPHAAHRHQAAARGRGRRDHGGAGARTAPRGGPGGRPTLQIIERLLTMASEIEEGRVPDADLADAVTRAIRRWGERAAQASSVLSGDAAGDPGPGSAGSSWTRTTSTRSSTC